MNDLRIKSVSFPDDALKVEFSDSRSIELPLDLFAKLKAASSSERDQWRLIGKGLGIHWEVLDEDISLENILLAYSRFKRGAYSRGVLV
jgi:hypothetical protein